MSKHSTPIRIKRSESQIRSILKAQAESNVPVKDFCKSHHLSRAIFYNWRKRYPIENEMPHFIAARLPLPPDSAGVFAEIEFPQNCVLRLFRHVDPSYLKALIKL